MALPIRQIVEAPVDPQLVERVERNGGSLELWQGDITRLRPDVEAIANAANSSLLGGGGVDGAIHRAAGPALFDECKRIGGCPTGEARITGAGRLPQKHVIHCVGPIYSAQNPAESARLLTATYRAALHLASERNLASLAFPSISTGVYGYPQEAAASLALRTLLEHLDGGRAPRRLLMVLFSHDVVKEYRAALRELLGDNGEGPRS